MEEKLQEIGEALSEVKNPLDLADAVRELRKAEIVLKKVNIALQSEAQMNAAKHMTDTVLPTPLASAVVGALIGITTAIKRYGVHDE